MKFLCGLFIAMLVVHLQCAGSCLTSAMDAVPACHHHAGDFPEKPQPPHEQNGLCAQTPVGQSNLLSTGKVGLASVPLLHITPAIIPQAAFNGMLELVDEGPPGL